MAEGQVSVRFFVQDGEVVRQALEKLGKPTTPIRNAPTVAINIV